MAACWGWSCIDKAGLIPHVHTSWRWLIILTRFSGKLEKLDEGSVMEKDCLMSLETVVVVDGTVSISRSFSMFVEFSIVRNAEWRTQH